MSENGMTKELRELLKDCRKVVRGRHSTIPYGPQSLINRIDALLASETSVEQPRRGENSELRTKIESLPCLWASAGAHKGHLEKPCDWVRKQDVLALLDAPEAPESAPITHEQAVKFADCVFSAPQGEQRQLLIDMLDAIDWEKLRGDGEA
jgi:hypothetical protein